MRGIWGSLMNQRKWLRYARIGLYVIGLTIFLELTSSLVLNNFVSSERMERFNTIFLIGPEEYGYIPHPYLGWVGPQYLGEQERYLSYLGENRTDKLYIVAMGGSTTRSGYPAFTESYLNGRLEGLNSSLRAVVFNFGVGSWRSLHSIQNYFYLLRYLHPDFVITHENVNELDAGTKPFQQAVLYYPQISNWERTLIRNSRFYRLLRFTYLLSYNPFHYGTTVVHNDGLDFPTQARLSSFLNGEEKSPEQFFRYDFTGESLQSLDIPLEFQLTENYGTLIKYTKADNSTLIMTTQHLNYSKARTAPVQAVADPLTGESKSRDVNNLIRDLSRQYHVPLIDLDREMEQYDYLLTEDGVHFNEEGIKLKGELIGEAIFDILVERYNLTD